MAEISHEVLAHCLSVLGNSVVSDTRWRDDEQHISFLGSVIFGYAVWLVMGDLESKLRSAGERPFEVFDDSDESRMFRGMLALTGKDSDIRTVLFSYLNEELHASGRWCSDYLEKFCRVFFENNRLEENIHRLIMLGYSAAQLTDKTFADAFFEATGEFRPSAGNPQTAQDDNDTYKNNRKSRASVDDPRHLQGQSEHVFLSYVREDANTDIVMDEKHVFISYVRENETLIEKLYGDLSRSGISAWLDRNAIQPGHGWRNAIRKAIEDGAFFLACFSKEYLSKRKSYMNEELTLAIDELRQYSTDRAWFIPVLLDGCDVPMREIGGGQTLRDLQWVDLSEDWEKGLAKLLTTLKPIKRKPPKSGNAILLDLSLSMEHRISAAVNAWIEHGRGADWLANGKAFFALNCWLFNRTGSYARAKYECTADTEEYRRTCYEACGGESGWDNLLRDHIACESCRENYRFENISIDARSMRYYCFRCAPTHEDVVG